MEKLYVAKSVDEAIQKGLNELQVTEDDVKIEVIQKGKRGLLGIGQKNAEVTLTIINPEYKQFNSIDALIERNENDTKELEKNTHEDTEIEPYNEAVDQASVQENVEVIKDPVKQTDKEEKAVVILKAFQETQTYIENVVKTLDIEVSSELDVKDNHATITFYSNKSGLLIGRRGATINALQEVAQSFMNSTYKGYSFVQLDTENYREKRKDILENLAINMSKKAIRTNEKVKLEPMPSYERKVMHHVLSRIDNIETYSEGREPNRYLVIERK